MDECRDIYEGIDSLYATVQELHRDESFPDTPDPQHPHLVPTLKPYQCRAVRWMLSRESKKLSIDDFLPSTTIELPSGGILADEMGLGKTVEALACILLNPRELTNEDLVLSDETMDPSVSAGEDKHNCSENQLEKAVNKCSPSNTYSKRKKRKENDKSLSSDTNFKKNENYRAKEPCPSNTCENDNICDSSEARNLDSNNDTSRNIKIESIFGISVNDFSPGESCLSQSQSEEVSRNSEIEQEPVKNSTNHKENKNSFLTASNVKCDHLEIDSNLNIKKEINCEDGSEVLRTADAETTNHTLENSGAEVNTNDKMDIKFVEVNKTEVDPLEISSDVEITEKPSEQVLESEDPVSSVNKTAKAKTVGRKRKSNSRTSNATDTKFLKVNKTEVDPIEISSDVEITEKPSCEQVLEAENPESPVNKTAKAKTVGRKRKSNLPVKTPCPSPPKRVKQEDEISDPDYIGPKIKSTDRKRKSEMPNTATPKKRSSTQPGATLKALTAWYEELLAEVKPKSRVSIANDGPSLHCFCESERERNTVQCVECKFYQHKFCVGFDGKKMKNKDYRCPSCITKRKPIPVKTTFIVSPASISDQWIEEIEKHTNPRLKVLKYDGVRNTGYIQPSTIAEYDVLLTTYESLSKELNYVPDECDGNSRSLRYAKRYFAPQSPLPCLQWWRICLDEAQMVECTTAKPSLMTQKLSAVHRWAVTGTPIQKTIDDLIGLVEFLGLEVLTRPRNWRALREKNDEFVYFLSRIMWRHSKHEVVHEFGVPPQTVKSVWLKFSAIESHFYMRQHTECSGQFLSKVAKYPSLEVPLQTIDRKEVNRILTPLLALRQACSHPQAVRGKLLSRHSTMTMAELLDIMVKKTQNESEDFLRQYICALNGIAGLHIIMDEIGEAIERYREVLQLCQHYDGSLHADTLQRIHTLHNLAEVLDFKPEYIPPTLRDSTAKEDAAKLEKEYLDKNRVVMTNTRQQAAYFASDISRLSNGTVLGFSDWWAKIIDWAPSSKELITQLKDSLAGTNDSFTSIAPKISSKDRVKAHLAVWFADMDTIRVSIIDGLHSLEITPTEDLVHKALCCHLRQSKKSKRSCPLCELEDDLKTYETHLFMVSKVNTMKSVTEESEGFEEEEDASEEAGPSSSNASSSLQALKKVELFQASWKGSWKNSQYLILLTELARYGRIKGAPAKLQNDSKQHLQLMNTLKREFKTLRLLWTQNSELVQSCDELVMAKMRLRLRCESDTPKKKVTNKADHIHIIEPHQISYELHRLRNESIVAAENLKRKTGTLLYLKNLQKEKSEDNVCPICRSEMKDKWAVLVCGHCICFECIPTMVALTAAKHVECAVCREKSPIAEISYVDCQGSVQDDSVKGSYSTKIEGIIRLVQSLLSEDSNIKILVFSSWEKVLDILEEGFDKNGINLQRLKSGLKHKNSVKKFKTQKDINVLLLQFKSGAKGLNLIEATHIILAEPVLNPSDELQAVGRVHRMGQTKPTFVHRFVIENTIEEKMLSAIKESEINQWRKNQITLKQLSQLFTTNVANSGVESESQPDS